MNKLRAKPPRSPKGEAGSTFHPLATLFYKKSSRLRVSKKRFNKPKAENTYQPFLTH
jgi:hypothetical protein